MEETIADENLEDENLMDENYIEENFIKTYSNTTSLMIRNESPSENRKESDEIDENNSEIDVSQFIKKIHIIEEDLPEFDPTHRTYYVSQCRKYNIVPSDIFLRNIEEDTLNMPHYNLKAKGIKPIVNTLIYNKTISKLNFSDNWLCDDGINNMMTMVRINDVITELNLSFNQLTSASAQNLSENLANSPILLRLDLSHNYFDDESATHFGELMILSLRLEYLNLSYNRFASDCVSPFGKAFLQTTSIVDLDLSFNSIGGKIEDIRKFTKGLSKNECFKCLNLSSNAFSAPDVVSSFGKMLKLNLVLEELNLNNNRIGTEAAVEFAKSMSGCKALKILRIGRNPMLSAGCYAIVNFILKNPNPKFHILDFESIDVNDEFRVLEEKLLHLIPDILVLTGVRMVRRIFPTLDPTIRMKYLSLNKGFSILEFFQRYTDETLEKCILLDDVPKIIDDFCEEYQFNLLQIDRRRIYKSFPRNEERRVSYSIIAKMFDEEYIEEVEEEEVVPNDKEIEKEDSL